MKELNFDTGVETFDLNGKIQISFNPTDSNFVDRLFNAYNELDKRQDEYKKKIEPITDTREILDLVKEEDEEVRSIIDGVFNAPVCDAVFPNMNVYALSGGMPVWCNLLLAVINELDSAYAREKKAVNQKMAKYTKKYPK